MSVIAGTTSGIGPMFARASTLRCPPGHRPRNGACHGRFEVPAPARPT
ncbi:MAG TPA: hypothetical protein VFM85_00150 [Actinomycetota bacterium]|nr:hypothetical protein [Actinomycetota bacterium]